MLYISVGISDQLTTTEILYLIGAQSSVDVNLIVVLLIILLI